MTDGTTGFHVAPITEDDMNRVTSILKRATDAIVGMSQLAADVDMLRNTVSGLQADTDRLRNQNNALDEALNYSRKARDEQAAKLSQVEAERDHAQADAKQFMETVSKLDMDLSQAQIDLDLTRKAKDDAEFHNLELEDKLKAAEAKLAKVAEWHKAIFLETESTLAPQPEQHPEPAQEMPKVDPDSVEHWEPGYYWDQGTMRYWRNGVEPKPDGKDLPF